MTRPKKDEKRAVLYLILPGAGSAIGTAGQYVGETDDYVVLQTPDNALRGVLWRDVEPVVVRETA